MKKSPKITRGIMIAYGFLAAFWIMLSIVDVIFRVYHHFAVMAHMLAAAAAIAGWISLLKANRSNTEEAQPSSDDIS